MKSRSRNTVLTLAGTVALLGCVVSAGVVWHLRRAYERKLAAAVWPAAGQAEPAQPAVAVSGSGAPTVLLLGDSRLAEWDLRGVTRGSFINAGHGGATTAQVLASTPELLRQHQPDIVVLEAGINDLKLLGPRPDLRKKVETTVCANLAATVAACRAAGCKVLILTIWPPAPPELLRRLVWSATVPESVTEVNRGLRALAAADADGAVAVADLFADDGVQPRYRDALHLQPQTYRELTPLLERRLRQLCRLSDPESACHEIVASRGRVASLDSRDEVCARTTANAEATQ